MPRMLTTVTLRVNSKVSGWEKALADTQNRMGTLRSLVPMVEKKIARGEPWLGTQSVRQ